MSRASIYRQKLLCAGFCPTTKYLHRFYKAVNSEAAWIIHLVEDEYCLMLYYGCTTIPATEDALDWLAQQGEDMDTCKLRSSVCIASEEDEAQAAVLLSDFFAEWHDPTKKAIVQRHKALQKEFLARIQDRLAPLGFRKKAGKWSIAAGDRIIVFEVQKSYFADQMYFNIYVFRAATYTGIYSPRELYQRVAPFGKDCYNWQLLSESQINTLLDYAVDKLLLPLIERYRPSPSH